MKLGMIPVAGWALLVAGPLAAQQPLTLGQALERARAANFGNRVAAAQARAQGSGQIAALRGVLPTIRVEAGYVRTTDPIGAFGTALRQRRVSEQNFDPQRLNFPAPVDNYTGAVVAELPLLNVDAHIGRRAAALIADAADASAAWTGKQSSVDVIRAYYGAVLAAEKVVTMEAALVAARAHVKQAELMVKAGLVTRSDALLAEVRTGEIETKLLEAGGELRLALRALAMLLGEPEASYELPKVLPDLRSVRAVLQRTVVPPEAELRSDIVAARNGARAAALDAIRASSLYLPRLNGVARYDWNSASSVYSGDKNWTVGVMASWTPFAGASEIAERRAAGARAAAGNAALAATRAQADYEISKADIEREIAVTRLDIAERALRQSMEAHRIISRKYQGGLASVVELLDGAAAETAGRLGFSHARYAGIVAAAETLKAIGRDPGEIASQLTSLAVEIDQ
jgi:outer membrane protein TolC